VHQAFADGDLYNKLLFFFEYHPFHNVLHQKVFSVLEKALSESHLPHTVNHLLYQTSLIKRILDTSETSASAGLHVFSSTGNRVRRGFLIYMRKIATKLVEV